MQFAIYNEDFANLPVVGHTLLVDDVLVLAPELVVSPGLDEHQVPRKK